MWFILNSKDKESGLTSNSRTDHDRWAIFTSNLLYITNSVIICLISPNNRSPSDHSPPFTRRIAFCVNTTFQPFLYFSFLSLPDNWNALFIVMGLLPHAWKWNWCGNLLKTIMDDNLKISISKCYTRTTHSWIVSTLGELKTQSVKLLLLSSTPAGGRRIVQLSCTIDVPRRGAFQVHILFSKPIDATLKFLNLSHYIPRWVVGTWRHPSKAIRLMRVTLLRRI